MRFKVIFALGLGVCLQGTAWAADDCVFQNYLLDLKSWNEFVHYTGPATSLSMKLSKVKAEEGLRDLLAGPSRDFEIDNFQLDLAKMQKAYGGDALTARERWFSYFRFDNNTVNFDYPTMSLQAWNILPHAPFRSLPAPAAVISTKYGSEAVVNEHLLSADFAAIVDSLTHTSTSSGNSVELLKNRDLFLHLVDSVKGAQHSILAATMILTCDPSLKPLTDALAAKAKAGVYVAIIEENSFALKFGACYDSLAKAGVHVIRSNEEFRLVDRHVFHDKLWMVDLKEAYVTGQNMIDTEVNSNGVNGLFRDTGVHVQGPVLADLVAGYKKLARHFGTELPDLGNVTTTPANPSGGLCRVIFQNPFEDANLLSKLYRVLIAKAEKSLTVSLLRFPTTRNEQGEWVQAVLDDIVAKQSVPGFWTDFVTLNDWKASDVPSESYDPKQLTTVLYNLIAGNEDVLGNVRGTRAQYLHLGGPNFQIWNYFQYMHQKVLVVDRTWVLIGSYNLDQFSAESSYEMMLMCADKSLESQVSESFILDILNSVPILAGK